MTNQPTHKAKTIDGQWVEGWYDPTGVATIFDGKYIEPIIESTLCRSTYRPDSNGTLMYEGDEVEVKDWEDSMRNIAGIYTIAWDEVSCGFALIADGKEAITFNEVDYYYLTGKNKHE